MVPPWFELPGYGFGLAVLCGAILRDRWLSLAALVLFGDWLLSLWINGSVPPDYAWCFCALSDLGCALVMAVTFKTRSIVLAIMLGINAHFYMAYGASYAFGNSDLQARVSYHSWWATEYLAFAILGLLTIGGFEDHGGKQIRRYLANRLRSDRLLGMESHPAFCEAEDILVETGEVKL